MTAAVTDTTGPLAARRAATPPRGAPRVAAGPRRSIMDLAAVRQRGCRILAPELPHGWLVVMVDAHQLMQRAGRHLLGEWMEAALRMLGTEHLRMSLPPTTTTPLTNTPTAGTPPPAPPTLATPTAVPGTPVLKPLAAPPSTPSWTPRPQALPTPRAPPARTAPPPPNSPRPPTPKKSLRPPPATPYPRQHHLQCQHLLRAP